MLQKYTPIDKFESELEILSDFRKFKTEYLRYFHNIPKLDRNIDDNDLKVYCYRLLKNISDNRDKTGITHVFGYEITYVYDFYQTFGLLDLKPPKDQSNDYCPVKKGFGFYLNLFVKIVEFIIDNIFKKNKNFNNLILSYIMIKLYDIEIVNLETKSEEDIFETFYKMIDNNSISMGDIFTIRKFLIPYEKSFKYYQISKYNFEKISDVEYSIMIMMGINEKRYRETNKKNNEICVLPIDIIEYIFFNFIFDNKKNVDRS